MSDIDKRLDEILENILHNYAMNLHEYSNGIWGHHNDYREQTDATKQIIKQLMVDEFEKLNTQLENALKLDLYSITPDELDEIVEKCEGKHIQQVVYSTYHKAFTRICFGCMQIDTTLKLKEWKDE